MKGGHCIGMPSYVIVYVFVSNGKVSDDDLLPISFYEYVYTLYGTIEHNVGFLIQWSWYRLKPLQYHVDDYYCKAPVVLLPINNPTISSDLQCSSFTVLFFLFFAFDFCHSGFFFIPATTANDLRLWSIFYPRFYPLHLFSYLFLFRVPRRWHLFYFPILILEKEPVFPF